MMRSIANNVGVPSIVFHHGALLTSIPDYTSNCFHAHKQGSQEYVDRGME